MAQRAGDTDGGAPIPVVYLFTYFREDGGSGGHLVVRGRGGAGMRIKRAVCEAIEAHAREEALLSAVPAVDHAQAEDTWPTL